MYFIVILQYVFFYSRCHTVMIVVIRRDIGNFPDVVGGVAHGHTQTRRFDHRAVIAGVAHGHRLRAGQAQVCRQRQQTAALRHAGGR